MGPCWHLLLDMEIDYDNRIYFDFVLPIIIFEAGFSMKKRIFFKNLGIISIFVCWEPCMFHHDRLVCDSDERIGAGLWTGTGKNYIESR